ncbi:hypothetical protein NPIL_536782 [Nephila pilipes]|nr:hypothetical protein NPIL_536782 [Nephila pilipes]
MTSLILGFENPKKRGDLLRELFQIHSDQSFQNNLHRRKRSMDLPTGKLGQFCSMFGCGCVRVPFSRCCANYLYDERSHDCRIVYK